MFTLNKHKQAEVNNTTRYFVDEPIKEQIKEQIKEPIEELIKEPIEEPIENKKKSIFNLRKHSLEKYKVTNKPIISHRGEGFLPK